MGQEISLKFDAVLMDFDGRPIRDSLAGDGVPVDLTLGRAARHALCGNFQDEQNLSGEDKFRRGKLAFDIADGGVNLKAEDVVLIKKCIAKMFGPLVVVQAFRLLDPAE